MSLPFLALQAHFKLSLLRSMPRYRIVDFGHTRVQGTPYERSSVKVTDVKTDISFTGMAEDISKPFATLLATAEAYERLCQTTFLNNQRLVPNLPFGTGVGFFRKHAQLRAWGEFFERARYHTGNSTVEPPVKLSCPAGTVFVCKVDHAGHLGTGYGTNATGAKHSAIKSAFRKRDFPQKTPLFQTPMQTPQLFRMTPQEDPWLECYLVGFVEPPT